MNNTTPARANVVVLKQMLNLIPRGLINRHARETGVEAKAGAEEDAREGTPSQFFDETEALATPQPLEPALERPPTDEPPREHRERVDDQLRREDGGDAARDPGGAELAREPLAALQASRKAFEIGARRVDPSAREHFETKHPMPV